MQKLLAFLLSASIIAFGLAVGCEAPSDNKLPCKENHNCDTSKQGCYKGFCTDKDKIPKETKDGGNTTPDKTEPKPDKTTPKPDKTTPKPDKPVSLSYPEGPYGVDVGDVAIPLDLAQCDGKGRMSLKDFYKHDKIKVIQLTVHTIWCPSCRTQSKGLGGIYRKYNPKGLAIMFVMTENAQAGSGKVSPQECLGHVSKYNFGFEPVIDSGSKFMRKYFDRNAVPLNIIITTKDMKIRYKKSGALPERMNGIIESYLPN